MEFLIETSYIWQNNGDIIGYIFIIYVGSGNNCVLLLHATSTQHTYGTKYILGITM